MDMFSVVGLANNGAANNKDNIVIFFNSSFMCSIPIFLYATNNLSMHFSKDCCLLYFNFVIVQIFGVQYCQ